MRSQKVARRSPPPRGRGPTLAESYKVAALDTTNKLRGIDRIGD